ncbi:MAG: hypothetical protein HY675_22695 [Chloroflexi bacterium]|nr:hypothetical protein [Chloroflexota bacterium]
MVHFLTTMSFGSWPVQAGLAVTGSLFYPREEVERVQLSMLDTIDQSEV